MRAFRWAALASLALLLLAPAPALAWLDYLEQFSGPHMKWGWDIEGRLVCFARKETSESLSAKAMFDQAAAFQVSIVTELMAQQQRRVAEPPQQEAQLQQQESEQQQQQRELLARRLADAWQGVIRAWNEAGVASTGAVDLDKVDEPLKNVLKGLLEQADQFVERKVPEASTLKQYITAAASARAQADEPENQYKITSMVPGVGVIWSACNLRKGERRRASVDLGMRFFGSDGDSRWAKGQRLTFTTIEPAFSWHIADSDKWDFVDFGVGAGYYWFSSEAFPSFGGYFLEPIRFDFHFSQNSIKCGKGWAAFGCLQFALVRYGLLVFPGGFETAQWAANADQPPRIARDWVNSVGFFVDLEAIAQWRKNRKK